MIASLILALHLFGIIPLESAAVFLFITGGLLLISEAFVTSFGIIALNGIIALFMGYVLQTGDNAVFGVPLDWPFLFGVAFVEIAIIGSFIGVILHYRGKKVTTGVEGMIGESAEVIDWNDNKGNVRVQGETWKATSDKDMNLEDGEVVTVEAAEGLTLKVKV